MPGLRAPVSDPVRVQPLHHDLEDTGKMLARCSEEKAPGNLSYHKEQYPDSNSKDQERQDPEAETVETSSRAKGKARVVSENCYNPTAEAENGKDSPGSG